MKRRIQKITFVTSNKGKFGEAQQILDIPLKMVKHELDELQSLNLEKIVKHKIEQAAKIVKEPFIVDDTGIYMHEWKGFPGPFVKFIYEQGGCELFLKMLERTKSRKGYALCVIGFYDGKTTHIFTGKTNLTIAEKVRGSIGWGFDPIFIPEGQNQTYAEMGEVEKNKVNHRKKALQKLQQFIKKNYILK